MNGYLSDKDYNFIYSRSPRICVDLIIEGFNYPMLVKRNISPYKGKYSLPGGKVNFRESIEHAIQRTASREIGCSVVVVKMVGFMEFRGESQNGNKRHSISIAFEVVPTSHIQFTNNIPEKSVHPIHYKFLKQYGYIK
jgi:ADP-ribose pyrophosphatase YjhB (NUDIX family)